MAKQARPQVFISHSSEDREAAQAICSALEAQRIRCWIAPRDVVHGVPYAKCIVDALETVRLALVVLSPRANASVMVQYEVERAASAGIPIIPLRIEDVKPAREVELFLSAPHWFDAFALPLESYLDPLVKVVRRRLRGDGPAGAGINVYPYMISRGPAAHRAYTERPAEPWDKTIRGTETIENLRAKLLYGDVQLQKPIPIKVQGTLFPCALLSSGWWERRKESKIRHMEWQDGLQEWLFHGFDLWGPSWDFTWDFENWDETKQRPYFIAQLGDGDEANSIPVLLPVSKAVKLHERLSGTWGGIEANVSGVLGHRKHFEQYVEPGALELFGGLLDYCLWLDEEDKTHVIAPRAERTELYSGYLWKCIAPVERLKGRLPSLTDVYFVWDHVNFANRDALSYCLEALDKKEEHIKRRYGDVILVQKSCSFVPGEPILPADHIYNMLLHKSGDVI